MTALHIERTGGFIGTRERLHVDDLDADAPNVHVEAFGSNPQDHALAPDHRDQLRAARDELRSDAAGAGGGPNGADRYVWTIRIDGASEPLVFHDPVTNVGARAFAAVAAQLFAAS
ncbi:MAG: hypothetical protein JWN72_323 [Thermoleophilia bacterium]|nr:hypothetical protein [Thermoleophilia bacterium]